MKERADGADRSDFRSSRENATAGGRRGREQVVVCDRLQVRPIIVANERFSRLLLEFTGV